MRWSLSEDREPAAGDCHTVAVTRDCDVYSWGLGDRGQVGQGDSEQELRQPKRIATLEGLAVRHVSCGAEHTACAAGTDVLCFGANDNRQCGILASAQGGEAPARVAKPKKVPFFTSLGIPISMVACGGRHTLALTATGQVFGWGMNGNGQLGLGAKGSDVGTPTSVEGLFGLPVTQVRIHGRPKFSACA